MSNEHCFLFASSSHPRGWNGVAVGFTPSDVLFFLASLPLVRKWFRTKRVTGLSFTARIERPQLYRGGSANKKDGPVTCYNFSCTSFHSLNTPTASAIDAMSCKSLACGRLTFSI